MKKRTFGGCVFQRNKKLYIKIGNKQHSTGLNATAEGWEFARQMLEDYQRLSLEDKYFPHKKKLSELFAEFLDYLERKNRSLAYKRAFRLAFQCIFKNNDFIMDNDKVLMCAKLFSEQENLSPVSKNIHFRHINIFCRWCNENYGFKIDNIYKKFKSETIEKVVEPYSEGEFANIYAIAESTDPEFAYLLKFLYLTGFRIAETLRLKWDDIDYQNKIIVVENKIKKGSYDLFPIHEQLIEHLVIIKSLASRRKHKKERVFRWSEDTKSRLTRRLNAIEMKLGIKIARQAFHRFRNTFSNKLIDSGLPVLAVRDLMRHKNIQTTLNSYKKFNAKNLKSEIEKVFK